MFYMITIVLSDGNLKKFYKFFRIAGGANN